jgi:hypothetical protein
MYRVRPTPEVRQYPYPDRREDGKGNDESLDFHGDLHIGG